MTIYLDAGAARIQTWLGRSATLRGRRGASSLLARTTRNDAIETWLAGEPRLTDVVECNDEAGDVDGVVSLRLTRPVSDKDCAEIAGIVLAHLRHWIPRIELNAAWTDAPSYVEAYPAIRHNLDIGEGLTAIGQPRTIPLAKTCEDCGIDGVTEVGYPIAGEETRDICADCAARYRNAGRRRGTSPQVVPGPELDLATWLANDLVEHPLLEQLLEDTDDETALIRNLFLEIPDDEEELASCTAGMDGLPGTHTALVFADGNRIGGFLSRAIAAGIAKTDVAAWITDANQHAVLDATIAAWNADDTPSALPIAPHLIAGDDLLVSLPARLAWLFTRTYLAAFTRHLDQKIQHAGLSAQQQKALGEIPTASAGIVFAHHTYPLTDVVRLAGDALARAKDQARGAAASIAWLDITQDGPHSSAIRPALPLATIDTHAPRLRALAGVPASRRRRLATHDPDTRRDELDREITRLDIGEARAFLDNPDLPLPVALDLIRWWA